MKQKLTCCLALALVVGLSGCSNWTAASYVSVTAHQEQHPFVLSDTMPVSNSNELKSALQQMVDNRLESATLVLEEYNDAQAEADLEKAVSNVQKTYPMAVYAEAVITYAKTPEQTIVPVTITYSRTKQQMDQVEKLNSAENVKTRVRKALHEVSSGLTFLVKGMDQMDYVQFVKDCADERPDLVIETPGVSLSCYPESGKNQIVELQFDYKTSRDTLRNMQKKVAEYYQRILSDIDSDADDAEKYNQLYRALLERCDWDPEENVSLTPTYTLLHDEIGDSKTFVLNFAALGRQAGLEIQTVVGTRNGEIRYWNICRLDDYYFHVDLKSNAAEDETQLLPRFDEDMEGYIWDYHAYPECIRPTEPFGTETSPTEE